MKEKIKTISGLIILVGIPSMLFFVIPYIAGGILIGGSWFAKKLITMTEDDGLNQADHFQHLFFFLIGCCVIFKLTGGSFTELKKTMIGNSFIRKRELLGSTENDGE